MSLPGLLVVGTDTGVGKTFVASAIARTWHQAGHRVGVLKPVASGAEPCRGPPRSRTTRSNSSMRHRGRHSLRIESHRSSIEEPLAPPVAALRGSGRPLDHESGRRGGLASASTGGQGRADVMIVEGVGGLLCPLGERSDGRRPGDPPRLSARHRRPHRGLGTLNHTLLTVEAARGRALRIAGIILNGARPFRGRSDRRGDERPKSWPRRLEGTLPILAEWEHGVNSRPSTAANVAPEAGGWYDLAKAPRRSNFGRRPDGDRSPCVPDTLEPVEEDMVRCPRSDLCPHCGGCDGGRVAETRRGPEAPDRGREPAIRIGNPSPRRISTSRPVPLLAPGSQDDQLPRVASASGEQDRRRPNLDPILGQFVTPSSNSAASTVHGPSAPNDIGRGDSRRSTWARRS